MRAFVLNPADVNDLPGQGRLSLCVHVGARPVRRGSDSGRIVIGEDFLSPAVVRGSPDNEKARAYLQTKPVREVPNADLEDEAPGVDNEILKR
jgi:hypothetical protein